MNWYIRKYNWLQAHPNISQLIIFTCTWLTRFLYVLYVVSILLEIYDQNWKFLLAFILVPAIGFLIETMVRAKLNRPRPYEVLEIPPLKQKDTKGKSFPSRHSFSAAILAISFYYLQPTLGVYMILLGIIIGICRVFMGVHWIKDVVAGQVFGWILGILGFSIFL